MQHYTTFIQILTGNRKGHLNMQYPKLMIIYILLVIKLYYYGDRNIVCIMFNICYSNSYFLFLCQIKNFVEPQLITLGKLSCLDPVYIAAEARDGCLMTIQHELHCFCWLVAIIYLTWSTLHGQETSFCLLKQY